MGKYETNDPLRRARGQQLRKSFAIRSPSAGGDIRFLHESQTSICIMGYHEHRWSAVEIIDDHSPEVSVGYYNSFAKPGAIFRADPLVCGQYRDPQNLRLYILEIVLAHVTRIAKSLDGVIQGIEM